MLHECPLNQHIVSERICRGWKGSSFHPPVAVYEEDIRVSWRGWKNTIPVANPRPQPFFFFLCLRLNYRFGFINLRPASRLNHGPNSREGTKGWRYEDGGSFGGNSRVGRNSGVTTGACTTGTCTAGDCTTGAFAIEPLLCQTALIRTTGFLKSNSHLFLVTHGCLTLLTHGPLSACVGDTSKCSMGDGDYGGGHWGNGGGGNWGIGKERSLKQRLRVAKLPLPSQLGCEGRHLALQELSFRLLSSSHRLLCSCSSRSRLCCLCCLSLQFHLDFLLFLSHSLHQLGFQV